MIRFFAFATGLIAAYPWVGYPLAVRVLAQLRGGRVAERFPPDELPSVTVLCIAHNEAALIGAQAESVLAQDYPADRLTYLLVLDDCTDATEARFDAIAARSGGRFSVYRLPERSGKAGGLAATWPRLTADVVVLTDANTALNPGAVSALVALLADPAIGAVAGVKRIVADTTDGHHADPEGIYWRFETWLKRQEDAAGISVAADGACWAVRRDAWDGTTPSSRSDDLWGSTQVLRQRRRTAFTTEAEAVESAAPSVGAEFHRKRRTALGLVLLLPFLTWLRAPDLRPHAWGFVSHKAARLLTPWALVAHVLVLGIGGRWARLLAAVEVAGAGATVLIALRPSIAVGAATRPARALGYFMITLVAWAVGTIEGLSRRAETLPSYWDPTSRTAPADSPADD